MEALLLIAAALMEELEVALNLCSDRTRLDCAGVRVWAARHRGRLVHFLKTGVGPRKSGDALERTLRSFRPSSILVIGYTGALECRLKLGDLAVIRRAARFDRSEDDPCRLETARLTETWDLNESPGLMEIARRVGTPAFLCDGVTSPHIIGEPEQKRLLYDRLGVSVIDMETAALARVAVANAIPISCVRAVSDEAADVFLAPLSYDPASTPVRRALRVLSAGNWLRRYGDWRTRAAVARESLHRFMAAYLSVEDESTRGRSKP